MPLQMRGGTGGIISAISTGNAILSEIEQEQSGDKDVIFRLDEDPNKAYRTFALTSTRLDVTAAAGYVGNEYGLPTPGSILDITFPSTAATIGMASTSTDDAGGGIGAIAVLIEGLDENFVEIGEAIVLTGQTKVASTLTYIAINNATVVAVGSTGWNVGTIYIGDSAQTFTLGVPQTSVYRTIGVDGLDDKGINACNVSTYTIPAGFTACPVNFKLASDATTSKPILIRGIIQPYSAGAYIGEITIGNLAFGDARQFTFDGFPNLPEKSRIIVRSRAQTTTVGYSALYWEWIMKRNGA